MFRAPKRATARARSLSWLVMAFTLAAADCPQDCGNNDPTSPNPLSRGPDTASIKLIYTKSVLPGATIELDAYYPGAGKFQWNASGGGSVTPNSGQLPASDTARGRWFIGNGLVPDTAYFTICPVNPPDPLYQCFGKPAIVGPGLAPVFTGDGQIGPPSSPLLAPVTFTAVDANGQPLAHVAVDWRAHNGGLVGADSTLSDTTDATGHLAVNWTLGPSLGQQNLEARWFFAVPGATGILGDTQFVATAQVTTASASCDAPGTDHTVANDTLSTSQTWTQAQSPHHINHGLRVVGSAQLTIEAGATVCFMPNSGLAFSQHARLVAIGSLPLPIVFTTPDSVFQSWSGLSFNSDSGYGSTLNHTVIAWAYNGIFATTPTLTLENSVVRQSSGEAVLLFDPGNYIHTVRIDTATLTGLHLSSNGTGTFQISAVVVHGAGDGILVSTVGATIDSSEVIGSKSYGIIASGLYPFTMRNTNLKNNASASLYNQAGPIIDAEHNWWGSGNGPAPGDTLGAVDASLPALDSVEIQGLPPEGSILRHHTIVATIGGAPRPPIGRPASSTGAADVPTPGPSQPTPSSPAPSALKAAGRPTPRARETAARIPASP
jgi:hypothetical protein